MPSPDTLAAAAVEMLDYATTPRQLEGTLERDYLLHPGLIQQAKALQFVLTQKAGLLLALGEGHGFTVFKLRTFDDGSTAWSAPCFLTAPSVSTGATVGKQQTCALLVVLSDKAAELLRAGHSTGAAVGAQANLTPPRGEWMKVAQDSLLLEDVVSLGLSDGLMVDLSGAVSALRVDAAQNEAVYGPGRSPADILGGQPVPAPPVFGDLYDKLNEVIERCA
ncbi:hypothetical protein D9Q98_005301 [Chlorella vulgaris]|uniref:Ysc84 actin-binding domain-containing protein n=1 Tax=Chlorella vulgaris TaxID=3077 RepID=A0A9D4TQ64_CHLVU|nr:hypothetical protein D9Q98_005301 [Chlorella vulgaris]